MAGVRIGAQTYSFRDRPLDQVPAAFKAAGLSFCELWSGHVEAAQVIGATRETPRPERRELARKWRLGTPMSHFAGIRKAFADAGVTITSYDVPYQDDWTDEEIARSFEMARALGVSVITSSAAVSAVIVLMGFLGGLTLSAVKRSLGAKDWGVMIEGHGGMLDRTDSICFAAPVFFHIVRFFHT